MLSTEAFVTWSERVVLCLHNTSHCADERHPDLLRKLGGNSFPTLAFVAPDGRRLMQLEHPTTLKTMQAGLERLDEWKRLRAAAARDSRQAKRLFFTELELGILGSEQARRQLSGFVFTEAESATVSQLIIDLEFAEILRATPPERVPEAGAKFVAMLRAERIPKTRQVTTFWQYIFQYAGAKKDPALFREMLDEMQRRHAGDPRIERYGGMLERQLEALKRAREKSRSRPGGGK